MALLLAQAEADAGVTAAGAGARRAAAPAAPADGAPRALPAGVTRDGRLWHVRSGHLAVTLNARRGLAIEAFSDGRIGPETLFGTLEHGYFPTIELGADWYTGDVVQEAPLRHKVTDLEPMAPVFEDAGGGVIRAFGRLTTELGDVEKVIEIDGGAGTVTIDTTLHWPELPPGLAARGAPRRCTRRPSIRTASSTRRTTAATSSSATSSPGSAAFDHGGPVSALVSCRQGLGATDGVLLLGDAHAHGPRRNRPGGLQAAGDRRLHARRRPAVLPRRAEHHGGRRHAPRRDRAQRRGSAAHPRDAVGGAMHVGLNLLFLVPGETGGMEIYARELLRALAGRAARRAPDGVRQPRGGAPRAASGSRPPTSSRCRSTRAAASQRVRAEQQLLPGLARRAGVRARPQPREHGAGARARSGAS